MMRKIKFTQRRSHGFYGFRKLLRESLMEPDSTVLEVPQRIAAIVAAAIIAIFVFSAITSTAPFLPMLSVVLLALASVELMLARYAKSADAARWDAAAAFVLVSAVAATLSEPEHILAVVGLTMPQ